MAMSGTRKALLIIGGILAVLVFVAVLGVAVLVSMFRRGEPTIRDNSLLTLRVAGSLPDYSPDDPLKKYFGGPDQSLTGLVMQFKKAKADTRIKAILLDVNMSGAGWGKSEEIRDAIADFRSSGKPVYAFMELGLNKEYYIATACDKIYVTPPGELFINGLAADVMFFRGSLDKLGIYPDIYQIGKYKSAGDMFTQKQMTDAHREYINSLLDDLYGRYVNAIAQARHKTPEEVRALIDNAPYNAAKAKEAGLIDESAYRDDVEKQIKATLGYKDSDTFAPVRGAEYRDVSPESLGLNKGERIAVIYATGTIGSGSSENSPSGEQSIGSDTLAKAVSDAASDKSIKAIVLRVDSPGGSGLASDIIWHAVEAANQKKPLVVSMSDVAASGGYYISAAASKIVAQPSTITGSIGVVAGKPVMRGFYDWLGISNEYVLRGKNAGMFRETEKFSDEERVKFEDWIKTTYYQDFVPKVAKGRNKDAQSIDSVGQGRVWTGAQAKDRGLVDEFGGLDRAIEVAKQLAKIPADKGVERVILPYPQTFLQQLLSGGGENSNTKVEQQRAIAAALPEDARRALRYMALMDRMKNGETMFLMPYDLRVK
ncbi:MAG TPA: signal peptide peptidase SppA [Pyrinomonadaceae bacterium]|jgi:protease-4|nr:signal peptide peptidase SppA [Pyrinomonadaceae bacterium]